MFEVEEREDLVPFDEIWEASLAAAKFSEMQAEDEDEGEAGDDELEGGDDDDDDDEDDEEEDEDEDDDKVKMEFSSEYTDYSTHSLSVIYRDHLVKQLFDLPGR